MVKQVLKVEYVNPKLDKDNTLSLLESVSRDNFEYGLIFKLQYIYGKIVSEVYNLKHSYINFNENKITFNINKSLIEYPLHSSVVDDLKRQCDGTSNFLFKHIGKDIDNFSGKLNYQLKKYDQEYNVHISPRDFKKLRGQHLILEGVGIKAISKLYHANNNAATIRLLLDYDVVHELSNSFSVEGILSDFTF